jgi:hypothetical protein
VTPSLSVGPACSLGFRAVTNALGAKSPRSATHERDALAQCWTCSLGFCATINALFGAESPGGATHERSPQGTYLAPRESPTAVRRWPILFRHDRHLLTSRLLAPSRHPLQRRHVGLRRHHAFHSRRRLLGRRTLEPDDWAG